MSSSEERKEVETHAAMAEVCPSLLPFVARPDWVLAQVMRSESFGDMLVEYHGPTFRLRVIRDKSQVFLSLARSDEESPWARAEDVLAKLGVNVSSQELDRICGMIQLETDRIAHAL